MALNPSNERPLNPSALEKQISSGSESGFSLRGEEISRPAPDSGARNEFEETIARILAIRPIEQTAYGDLEISFGPVKRLSLTSHISTTSAEVVISLRHFSGGINGIKTGIAYMTEGGLQTTSTLHAQDIYCPDEKAYATTSLAHLEGLVFGAANIFGEATLRSRARLSIDGMTNRSTNVQHTEDVTRAIDVIGGRIHSPNLGRPALLTITPIEGSDRHAPRGFDFALSVQNIFTATPLLRCRLDGASPLVEVEFVAGAATRTIHTFPTTQATLNFIVGVCNGAITAEAAQRYNSLPQRFLRRLGLKE
jgi:hypothetical protein